ncbi:MAG TPA: TolC family protein [Gemmatimonadales bacterium]|nr:TolC family protein [Gemmatimonadales bacterium]
MTGSSRLTVAAVLLVVATVQGRAQQPSASAADSLRLGDLHQQAVAGDPRQRQFGLLAKQTELRLRSLSAERLPSFSAEAHAQYQSDVFSAPDGVSLPTPPKDTYDSRLVVEQAILDPTIGVRQKVEQAQLAESEAGLQTNLFGLREEVNQAFFGAALLAERGRIIAATIGELEKQLHESSVRVREGAALPSDTAAIQATLLERRQDQAEVEAHRGAALVRLTDLVKRPISVAEPLALPDLAGPAADARRGLDSLRVRPEFEQFARTRDVLARQRDAVSADQKPRLSAFGHAGYGRPGLNPINTSFDAYYVAGLQVRWTPWNWGRTGRERDAIALQRQIVASEEAAFASRLTRDVQNDLADIDRLETALALDDQIIALRERVEAETAIRFREGVVTASEYVDRSTDVLEARLARATHRVEQVQARARFLTALGLEIR